MADVAIYFLVTAAALATGAEHLGRDRLAWTIALFLLFALPFGQTRLRELTYPFDNWGMYAEPHPPRNYYRFLAQTLDGREYDFPFQRLAFTSPGPLAGYATLGPISWRLVQMVRRCGCANGNPDIDKYIAFLRATTQPREQFVVFRIVEVAIAPGGYTNASPTPLYIWEFPKDEGRHQ
jgi:hypothetical protein